MFGHEKENAKEAKRYKEVFLGVGYSKVEVGRCKKRLAR